MKVKILLKDTVDGLGMIGDIVDVVPGYARNYILPKKLGLEVNSGTMQAIDAAKKKRAELEAQRKLSLEELAAKLADSEITITEKFPKLDLCMVQSVLRLSCLLYLNRAWKCLKRW